MALQPPPLAPADVPRADLSRRALKGPAKSVLRLGLRVPVPAPQRADDLTEVAQNGIAAFRNAGVEPFGRWVAPASLDGVDLLAMPDGRTADRIGEWIRRGRRTGPNLLAAF